MKSGDIRTRVPGGTSQMLQTFFLVREVGDDPKLHGEVVLHHYSARFHISTMTSLLVAWLTNVTSRNKG